MVIPENPELCPWNLLKKYVHMTTAHAPEGSFAFRALAPPYKAMCANSIGSLTRQGMSQLGIDTTVWKPHSTRGAGATMLKKVGIKFRRSQ